MITTTQMEQLFNYITSPETIVSFIIFVFTLWGMRSNLNSKQKELERRLSKLEDLDLDSRLERMQVDLDRIKTTLDELKRKH